MLYWDNIEAEIPFYEDHGRNWYFIKRIKLTTIIVTIIIFGKNIGTNTVKR